MLHDPFGAVVQESGDAEATFLVPDLGIDKDRTITLASMNVGDCVSVHLVLLTIYAGVVVEMSAQSVRGPDRFMAVIPEGMLHGNPHVFSTIDIFGDGRSHADHSGAILGKATISGAVNEGAGLDRQGSLDVHGCLLIYIRPELQKMSAFDGQAETPRNASLVA
jgi:hypothetical protein